MDPDFKFASDCAEAILSKVKRQSPKPQHLTEFIKTEILKANAIPFLYYLVSARLQIRIEKGLFKKYKKYIRTLQSRQQWREMKSHLYPDPIASTRSGRSWAYYKK